MLSLFFYYLNLKPVIFCESFLSKNMDVSIMTEHRSSFLIADKLSEKGYNVTIGVTKNPRYVVQDGFSCPSNFRTTNEFEKVFPFLTFGRTFWIVLLQRLIIPCAITMLIMWLIYVTNFYLIKGETFKIAVKINFLPHKTFPSGCYKATHDTPSEISVFNRFIIKVSSIFSLHFYWDEKQVVSQADVLRGVKSCIFKTDEMTDEKYFSSKTTIENGIPALSFTFDEMKINAIPAEFPFIDLLPVNDVFRLSFTGFGVFHGVNDVNAFNDLASSFLIACDLSGAAVGSMYNDNKNILSLQAENKEVKDLLVEYFNKFGESDQHHINVVANTIGQYRIWGAAVTLGMKKYIVVCVRQNKTAVLRGPEFVTTQLSAFIYSVIISLLERDSASNFEKVFEIHNVSKITGRMVPLFELIKNGYLLPFDAKTDFSEAPFKFDNASILPIIKKKKNCIVNPGNNKQKFFVLHFPGDELRGFISFIKDESAKAPIIHMENMPFMGWLVRVDTLEIVWYLSSSATTIDDVIATIHNDDKPAFKAAVEQTRQFRQVDMAIIARVKIGNVYKACKVLLFRTSDDYFVITASDEEEINQRIAELNEMERTVSLALSSGNVTLWNYEDTTNPSRIFLNWSDTKPSCLANRTTIESNIPMEYQQNVFNLFKKCMNTGEPFIIDAPFLIGTIRWCSIRGIRTGPNSLQLLIIDITQTKEAEERVIFEKKRVEEAANAKTRFLANMSHEIRNPLNGISGLIELLCDTKLPNTNDESIEILTTSFGKLLDLLNDTLDLAKIEQKKMTPSLTNFNPILELSTVIRKVKKATVPVITKTDPGLPILIYGDPHFFQRIASNLLSNAVKFTHDGYVRLIMSSDGDAWFKLEVEDTGIGMSEEDQQQFFGIFTMGDSSIRRPYGGIGVGLALCTKMLSLLGGRMELKSVVGKGSTFTVHFPFPSIYVPFFPSTLKQKRYQILELTGNKSIIAVITPHCNFYNMEIITDPALACDRLAAIFVYNNKEVIETARATVKKFPRAKIFMSCEKNEAFQAPDIKVFVRPIPLPNILSIFSEIAWRKQQTEKAQNLAPLHVLLAEDNTTNQLVMRKMFQKLKIDATIVENGREAINELEKSKYDVLFLDEYMPVLDGPSAAREIRMNEKYNQLTIIALTASHGKDDETICLSAGMNAFVTKPVTLKMMRDVLIKCAQGQITANTKTPL